MSDWRSNTGISGAAQPWAFSAPTGPIWQATYETTINGSLIYFQPNDGTKTYINGTDLSRNAVGNISFTTITSIEHYDANSVLIERVTNSQSLSNFTGRPELLLDDILSGNDTLVGTNSHDDQRGGAGDDVIFGSFGPDNLSGEEGNDIFRFAQADLEPGELLNGGPGYDVFQWEAAQDIDFLGASINGIEEFRFLTVENTTVTFRGQLGAQGLYKITGSAANDTIIMKEPFSGPELTFDLWTPGQDKILWQLSQSAGPLALTSQDDIYYLTPGRGFPLNGGGGNDRFVYGPNSLPDSIDGGDGTDTIELNSSDVTFRNDSATLVNIEWLAFNAGSSTFHFDAFSGPAIEFPFSNIIGGPNADAIVATGPFINLSGLTFTSWMSAVDMIIINGSDAAGTFDSLVGSNQSDRLFGLQGEDLLDGGAGDDVLDGGAGNDYLDGGPGSDTMTGGLGDDIYVVDSLSDVVIENPNNGIDEIRTSLASFTLIANVENLTGGATTGQTLFGNGLDNVINGGSGADHLAGGLGNDTYVLNNADDVVIENAGEGTDLVQTTLASFVLGANVENLTFTDGATHSGFGNSFANVMTGSSGKDTLHGGDGNDELHGGQDADVLFGDANNDLLEGENGDDTLDGGANADIMAGSLGNDLYFVDNIGDVVVEDAGEGNDIVYTAVDYTLPTNVEAVILQGTANLNAAGNDDVNALIGNSGNNNLDGHGGDDYMVGGAGNDIYFIDSSSDVVVENPGEGSDIVYAALDYTIGSNIEAVVLTGTANLNAAGSDQVNALVGNAGNNNLDGHGGDDYMVGGAGDDIYFVDSSSDVVVENLNEGADIVYASIDYTIGPNVESVVLTGTANLNAAGGNTGNALIGNAGNNALDGRGGGDYLVGNGGNDQFVFGAGEANGDIIADFDGAGPATGDTLRFIGYGAGTFTQVDATHWSINSANGAVHDVILLQNGASVQASDYSFA